MVHYASLYRWIVATRYWDLPQSLGGGVLDIGADDGFFLSQVEAPIKIGVDLHIHGRSHVPIFGADARRLPFASSTFDHIFAFDILEHIEQDRQVVDEMMRVLKPEGMVWGSVPALNHSVSFVKAMDRRYQKAWGHVRRGYSVSQLQSLFPDATDIAIFPWNEFLFRWLYSFLKALSLLNTALTSYFTKVIARLDARLHSGTKGHLFFKVICGIGIIDKQEFLNDEHI